ncbi:MAG: trypsin-like peptidase domain-containing protein [Spirochaetota bacterium]
MKNRKRFFQLFVIGMISISLIAITACKASEGLNEEPQTDASETEEVQTETAEESSQSVTQQEDEETDGALRVAGMQEQQESQQDSQPSQEEGDEQEPSSPKTAEVQPKKPATGEQTATDKDIASVEHVQNTFNSVVNEVLPSVVELKVTSIQERPSIPSEYFWFFDRGPRDQEERETKNLGSGVVFQKDDSTYYVLTNHHVAGEADSIEVVLEDKRSFEAELIGTDERRDLSVVSFTAEGEDIPTAELGDSDELNVGDWVLAMGSPYGYISSVTAGIVSAMGRSGEAIGNINDFIQTDAAINSGNSGGPLVNIYGEVVGINTWIAAPSGGSVGIGFAIPINNAKEVVQELIEFGRAIDGWLGISMLDINTYESIRTDDADAPEAGVFVANVYLNSPAYAGGIRPGDIITTFNDTEELGIDNLSRLIGNAPLKEPQELEIYRDGEYRTITVTLEERKTSEKIQQEADQLWPGILPIELTDKIISSLSLEKDQQGVMVQFMTTDAEENKFRNAGLKNYDVITHINNEKITSVDDFYRFIADDSIEYYYIDYVRNGRSYSTGVRK